MAEEESKSIPFRVKDISGQRFGRLVAKTFHDVISTGARWLCVCDCGNSAIVTSNNLKQKMTISCGCYRRETTSKSFKTHGKRKTREYNIWLCAKNRCFNPRAKHFSDYGGRGITMCPEWAQSFEVFLRDMGNCPDGMSLDRRDNDLGYSPENCRWTTVRTQNLNQRRTVKATRDGETLSLSEWAERDGVPYSTLYSRHYQGRPIFEKRDTQGRKIS